MKSTTFNKPLDTEVKTLTTTYNSLQTTCDGKQRVFRKSFTVAKNSKYVKLIFETSGSRRIHVYQSSPTGDSYYNTVIYTATGGSVYFAEIYKGSAITTTKTSGEFVVYRNETAAVTFVVENVGTNDLSTATVYASSDGTNYTLLG